MISNTDQSKKSGTHWCGTLDIHPKREIFFFNAFGIIGLKNFQDDQKTIEKILIGIEKMKRTENKLMLVKIKISVGDYKSLSKKEVLKLSNSASDLFHFINKFRDLHRVKTSVSIYMFEDIIQTIELDNCRPFQLYFFENLFDATAESELFEHKKLTKNTVEVLLNNFFLLTIENNEKTIKDYTEKKTNIAVDLFKVSERIL